jgi:hypothetical protein
VPDVGVVLDTSAVLAYAAGAERVGLFVALLADRDETAVIPATCLAAAYREVDLTAWDLVDLLASHPHVVVAPLEHYQCPVLGDWARVLGLDLAHAAIESASHAVTPLMTGRRELVGRVLPKQWPIIDLE